MKAFRIGARWLDYAHGPGAEDGQPVATQIIDLIKGTGEREIVAVTNPLFVAEIADVAELYLGEEESAAATRAFERAVEWLKASGVKNWRAFHKMGMAEAEKAAV